MSFSEQNKSLWRGFFFFCVIKRGACDIVHECNVTLEVCDMFANVLLKHVTTHR